MAAVISAEARTRASSAADAFLRVYAQILFSRSPSVGLVVLAATATVPRALVSGALAVLCATGLALLLDLERDAVASGDYGYGALLVGLGVGQTFGLSAPAIALLVAGAAASVLVTSALRSHMGSAGLPVLSLPFLAAFQLVLGAAAAGGVAHLPHGADPSGLSALLPPGLVLFVRSLGGLFFLPRFDSGALVFIALVMHSRIAASLAASAFTAVLLLASGMAALPEGVGVETLGYNAMLTAVALGGVFFVPSVSSFLLALFGASLSALLAVGLAAPLSRLGVPIFIYPFNLAVVSTLLALRGRARDGRPKSVDFLSGTPEENLAYFRTRRSRFQQLYPVAFQLPVRGVWTITQAADGDFTHKGPWRHAFDFEVRDADGHFARGPAASNDDFHCFRLPVLAAGDGTVVAIENGVPDNAVGAVNVEKNWGNYVLIQHGVGLYSLVAHLARGSVKVYAGQPVRRGDVIGLCGSSGRSPRPHVHFHLQGTPVIGAPTLPCRFTDVVVEDGEAATIETALEPAEGTRVRNLSPDDEGMASYFAFTAGRRFGASVDGSVERLVADLDLYGRHLVRSCDRQATLFYGLTGGFFTAYDVVGEKGSVLHLLRAALPRVPFEANEALTWTDHLPARHFRPWLGRVLFDLLSPFLPRDGVEMEFRMRREGAQLVILGASKRRDRRGEPLVQTRAELSRGVGPTKVLVTARGRGREAVLALQGGNDLFSMKDEGGLS